MGCLCRLLGFLTSRTLISFTLNIRTFYILFQQKNGQIGFEYGLSMLVSVFPAIKNNSGIRLKPRT